MNNYKTLCGAVLLLTLVACSKLTTENYDKLRVGMSYDEVTGIFGAPDQCNDVMGLRNCEWGDEKRGISVSFAGKQVVLYSARNLP